MPTEDLRLDTPRRDDAWHQRTGNPPAHQGHLACNACGDGHQERRGEHHGPSHRLKDCRLPHQARQPQPDSPDAEEKHPPSGDRDRSDPEWLPAELRADCHADRQLPHMGRLARALPHHRTMGTGTEQHRQFDDRHAQDAERRSQQRLCQIHQEQLSRVD